MTVRSPLVACSVLVAFAAAASAQAPAPAAAPAPMHKMTAAAEMVWGAGPPALPAGVKMAVVAGDPGAAGPFTIRADMPKGYTVPPHWHPTTEHVTVLSGTLAFGMGDKVDAASMKDLGPGGFAVMPAEMRHYVIAKEATVIQVHGMGPFALTYVNPADDPRNTAAAK